MTDRTFARIGLLIRVLVTLAMAAGAAMDISLNATAMEGMATYGYPIAIAQPLGFVLLASALLYAWPRTSLVGTALLTAYLGGAVATHVRAGESMATKGLIPVVFGVVVWVGLLSSVAPLRRAALQTLRGE